MVLHCSRAKEKVNNCRHQDIMNKSKENIHNNCKLCAEHFKAYKEPNFGGLNVPSTCYLEYIIKLENALVNSFSATTKNSNVGANILKIIEKTRVISCKSPVSTGISSEVV